jgi:hypothetical protein
MFACAQPLGQQVQVRLVRLPPPIHLVRIFQCSPLRSGARQRHCSGRRPLHSVRRRLQLSGRLRPQRSGRHRRLLSEHRHRRQHLARQPLRSVGARCSGRVRLLSAQARRQPSGARRRHHRLVSKRVVAWEWHGGCGFWRMWRSGGVIGGGLTICRVKSDSVGSVGGDGEGKAVRVC